MKWVWLTLSQCVCVCVNIAFLLRFWTLLSFSFSLSIGDVSQLYQFYESWLLFYCLIYLQSWTWWLGINVFPLCVCLYYYIINSLKTLLCINIHREERKRYRWTIVSIDNEWLLLCEWDNVLFWFNPSSPLCTFLLKNQYFILLSLFRVPRITLILDSIRSTECGKEIGWYVVITSPSYELLITTRRTGSPIGSGREWERERERERERGRESERDTLVLVARHCAGTLEHPGACALVPNNHPTVYVYLSSIQSHTDTYT